MITANPIPTDQLPAFCQRWNISTFALFGSVLREDFRDGSDIDVLVTFAAAARPTLLDIAAMERELEQLFGHPVDLLERTGVEQMRNPFLRRAILSSAEVIHAG